MVPIAKSDRVVLQTSPTGRASRISVDIRQTHPTFVIMKAIQFPASLFAAQTLCDRLRSSFGSRSPRWLSVAVDVVST
ncbi:MAG: hypothetical protein ACFB0D_21460 [Phormidesmis sp.]